MGSGVGAFANLHHGFGFHHHASGDPGFEPVPNASEVAQVFEVPLSFLMNPAHHRRHVYEAQGVRREWYSMPYSHGEEEHFIWGATAGMLRNFYRFLSA